MSNLKNNGTLTIFVETIIFSILPTNSQRENHLKNAILRAF
jgi:hypothetical protein